METKDLEELIQLMQKYGMQEISVSEGDRSYKLVQNASGTGMGGVQMPMPYVPTHSPNFPTQPSAKIPFEEQAPSKPSPSIEKGKKVTSPFVGTFYRSSSPGTDPFVSVGQSVRKGDTLCIVEAMKMMNEIEADQNGVISKILVENEEPVEYGQNLFIIE